MFSDNVPVFITMISNVGFPIFVAVWLLWRSDRIMRELTEAIGELRDILHRKER